LVRAAPFTPKKLFELFSTASPALMRVRPSRIAPFAAMLRPPFTFVVPEPDIVPLFQSIKPVTVSEPAPVSVPLLRFSPALIVDA